VGRKYPLLGLNRRCRSALQQIQTHDPDRSSSTKNANDLFEPIPASGPDGNFK